MRIGIAFDLKPATPGATDDQFEEFDSPETIAFLRRALESAGHQVTELGNGRPLLEALMRDPPDLVFNLAEGSGSSRSREARVPAVCEMLGIPYTGSDPLTLAVALDKDVTRRLVSASDMEVPDGIVIELDANDYDGDFAEFPPTIEESGLTLPLIAKPVSEGSSKGIRAKNLITRPEDIGPVIVELWQRYGQPVLVEEFIVGDEVTVAVLGNGQPRVFGTMKISPRQPTDHFVYGLEVKRDWRNRVDYEIPAKLPAAVNARLEEAAIAVYDALGCRDVARLDFRIRDGVPYFIEINPLPGLNPGIERPDADRPGDRHDPRRVSAGDRRGGGAAAGLMSRRHARDSRLRHERQHVRALGDHCQPGRGAVFRERFADGLLDRGGRLDPAAPERFRVQPAANELDPAVIQYLRQLFELPLVHDEVFLAQDLLLEDAPVGCSCKIDWNSSLPTPSLRLAAMMMVPPFLTIGSAPVMPLTAW